MRQMVLPNTQCPICMVASKNGMPMRKHSSAMAKFKIYIFVTVCMFEKRSTTYMTNVLPIKPIIQTIAYRIIKKILAIGMCVGGQSAYTSDMLCPDSVVLV